MEAMNMTAVPMTGDGAVFCHGPTVGFVAAPVEAATVSELQLLLGVEPREARLRAMAGVMLQFQVTGSLVEIGTDSSDVFALGWVDVIAGGVRHAAGDHLTGFSLQVPNGSLQAIVAAGAEPVPTYAWEALHGGCVRGGGVSFRNDNVAVAGVDVSEVILADEAPPPVTLVPPPAPTVALQFEPAEEFELVSMEAHVDLSDRVALPIDAESVDAGGVASSPEVPPPAPTGQIVDGASALDATSPTYAQSAQVLGVLSPRGYFNHPDALFCSRTGVKMGASATKVLEYGDRPPLGVFTFNDGSTLSVQWPLIMGRDPMLHERVVAGSAAPHVVNDPSSKVSRQHLAVDLFDWDVLITDLETANGSYINPAGSTETRRLSSGERVALRSGDTVHLGDASFTYHDHHIR